MWSLKVIIVVIFFFSSDLYAQEKEHRTFGNEIGFNLSSFTSTFLPIDIFEPGQFIINYRQLRNDKALRIGLNFGGRYNQRIYPAKYSHYYLFVALSGGYEWHRKIHKLWKLYYGLDGFYMSANMPGLLSWNSQTRSGYNEHTSISGIAPLIGIEYKMIPRIYLTFEINLPIYLLLVNNAYGNYYFLPILNDELNTNYQITADITRVVFLNYRF